MNGSVEVQVHQTVFTLNKGGQFFVPRGIIFFIKVINIVSRTLEILLPGFSFVMERRHDINT